MLVKNHLDEMASGIHTAHTSRRERFSYKRLLPVLGFNPHSFKDGKVFSKWLSHKFYPHMVHLRVKKGLAIESLRENCGHLAKWMLLHGVPLLMIDQFKAFVSIKRGQMWKYLVKDGGASSDAKPRLTTEDIRNLLRYTDELVKDPTMLISTNMKYRKKKGEDVVRYRRCNLNIALRWTCRDLNSGPLPCQGSDLPTDLHAHCVYKSCQMHSHDKHFQSSYT